MPKKPTVYEIERQAHNEPITMTINSKVPNKWRFCDLETNQVYKWDEIRKEFVIAELPSAFPNFGDKSNIMDKAREFTIQADKFYEAYDEVFKYDHSKPADIIQIGMNVTKALDKFYTALVLWKLELNQWYRGKMVEQIINEKNKEV